MDEKNDQIALRRIVAGREILRNDERNSNSPETGFEAANSTASGAEKDSANSTNGSALGNAALTNGRNSRYERTISAG